MAKQILTKEQQKHLSKGLPIVSLHIPAYNEEFTIEKCLTSAYKQNCPKEWYEIVVVDNNSKDETKEIVKNFQKQHSDLRVFIVDEPTQGVQYARKRGMETGLFHQALILAGTDADAVLAPNHIENIITTISQHGVDGYVGAQNISQNILNAYSWFSDYWKIREASKRLWANYLGEEFNGNCFAITTIAYQKIGGQPIHPDWPAGEDVALSEELKKINGKIVYSNKAPVTVSDRRYRPKSGVVHSHLPKAAGGAGFPAARDTSESINYPRLTKEEVANQFRGIIKSFARRLCRRIVSYQIPEDRSLNKDAYQKIITDFLSSKDPVKTFKNEDLVSNYWQVAEELFIKNRLTIEESFRRIFAENYPQLNIVFDKYLEAA